MFGLGGDCDEGDVEERRGRRIGIRFLACNIGLAGVYRRIVHLLGE